MDIDPSEGPMKRSIIRRPALSAPRLIGALGAGLALTMGVWLLLAMGNRWASWLAPAPTSASPATRPDDVVAIIDGEAIPTGEWSRTLAIHRTMSRLAGKAEPDPEEVLQQLIDQHLVLRWARSRELSIRPEEAAERLRAMLSAWNVSEPQLDEALGSAGLSRQDLLQEIQRLMRVERALPELQPSPEEWLAQQRARSRISVYRPMAAVEEAVREKRPAESAPTLQASPITTPSPAGPYPDQQAPDFALPDLEGKTFRLADLRGRPVILHFWATWCPVCRQETPALATVDQRYRALGIVLLGINLREHPENVQGFIRSFGPAFPILLDGDGSVATRYQVTGIPTTIFIDPSGVVRARHVGPIPESQWEEYIRRILPHSGDRIAPPDIGEMAPDFALPRENGEILRLSDYRGRSSVVLVFYRSPG